MPAYKLIASSQEGQPFGVYVIVSIVLLSHDTLDSGTYLSKFLIHRPVVM